MDRRAFLALASGLPAPLATRAEQSRTVTRVGFFYFGLRRSSAARYAAFLEGMRELGYVEGHNLVVEACFGESKTRAPARPCSGIGALARLGPESHRRAPARAPHHLQPPLGGRSSGAVLRRQARELPAGHRARSHADLHLPRLSRPRP